MKKLMFAAAALTAGFAMAEIVSSDIVGYAQSGLKSGSTMVTAQFSPITGESIALEDLTPVGDGVEDAVVVQTLDAFGYTVDSYEWNSWAQDTTCWVDGNLDKAEGVSFTQGQGLWVQGSAAGQGLQSAGKVGTADLLVQLRSGSIGVGNPFPITVDLNDIIPEGEGVEDAVVIQTLDAFGYTVDSYEWNSWAQDTTCWVDGNLDKAEGVSFAPGQGLWVQGASTAQYLRFPAPEL